MTTGLHHGVMVTDDNGLHYGMTRIDIGVHHGYG